jgi:hypothetical protein
MTTAGARRFRQLVVANEEQRKRLGIVSWGDRWTHVAPRLRFDPRRDVDESFETLASYVAPEDTVLDVGGGSGRMALPLAGRCREVINIEPDAGMGAEFEASAREAGVANARWLRSDWLGAAVDGDVALVTNVVSFVRDIVPFLEKLRAATRRRVMIVGSTNPFWDEARDIFRAVYRTAFAPLPEYRDLLPVLWEMEIVPDVRVLGPTRVGQLARVMFATRDEAIEFALRQVDAQGVEAHARVAAAFDGLFVPAEGGFRRPPSPLPRVILITWETSS